ncbi:MAG: hypothetical protein MRJ68_20355 [Nitrospira sp.]|nr:hypothetical protein [Nitrospira sp.]
MRNIYVCLLSVVWCAVPVPASANTWTGFGASWMDRDGGSQLWFEQDAVIQTVADHRLGRDDRFRREERVRSSRETTESRATTDTDRERSHESDHSGNTRNHSATFAIIHPTVCIAPPIALTPGGGGGRRAIR